MQWWRQLLIFEAGSGSGRVRWRGKGSAFDGCVRRERYALGRGALSLGSSSSMVLRVGSSLSG